MARLLSATILTVLAMFAGEASAQSICGSFNLLDKDGAFVADFLNKYSLGPSGGRRACGLPGEAYAVCQACSDPITQEMAQVIQPLFARRDHRAWHRGWHRIGVELAIVHLRRQGVDPQAPPAADWHRRCPILRARRTSGSNEGTSGPERSEADILAEWKTWLPEKGVDEFIHAHNVFDGELAGEDFLYMHREMIKMAQIELSYFGKSCIAAWREIPSGLDDAAWPVPAKASRSEDAASLETLRGMVAKLRDPALLRTMSLNDLGHCINSSIHGGLHNVYAGTPRCRGEDDESVECDDLLPSWSAPVNKHFWKLHGLVDDLIGDWLKAHGKTRLAEKCEGRKDCHEWRGKFTGPMPK